MTLLYILLACVLSGVIALLAAFIIFRGKFWSHERSHLFLSFAAGTLIAVAFLDLVPEALAETTTLYILLGFLLFFSIEKFILWYHCHEEDCAVHASAPMVLIGDTLHNFLDGVAIAVAWLIDPAVGIATTVAVFAHEIPQEVADFGILLGSGMPKKRALLFNVLSSLASILGALVAYAFATAVVGAVPILTALTAGGFIYIAAADLIPEIHKERQHGQMVGQYLAFLAGILIIVILTQRLAA